MARSPRRRPRRDTRRGRKRNLAKTTANRLIASGTSWAPRNNPVGKVEYTSSTGIPRNKQVIFKFDVRAKTQGVSKYAVSLIFNKVEFTDIEDPDHPLQVGLGGGGIQYIEKLSRRRHPVLVRCSCPDFFFTWGKADFKNKALVGPDSYFYVRKTPPPPEGYPYKNPDDVPGPCKHIKACFDFLTRNNILTRS